jgi:glycosyltransferase involved in cell wall biosynthesis
MDAHERLGFFRRSRRVVLRNPAPAAAGRRKPSAAPAFLFAGQLERHKGVTTLLDAWEKFGLPGAALEIAGAGSLESEVRARAARLDGVVFSGKLSPEQVIAACDRASYVLVPSLVIENAPAVIMEALSRGTPVIASATGGIPELVREGETGYLVPPGDPDALAAVMAMAVHQRDRWPRLSAGALALAAENGPDAHLRALLDVYGNEK